MEQHRDFNLENAIREVLAEECRARCLDDKEDFGAVMEAISDVIERWIDNRCPGCR